MLETLKSRVDELRNLVEQSAARHNILLGQYTEAKRLLQQEQKKSDELDELCRRSDEEMLEMEK